MIATLELLQVQSLLAAIRAPNPFQAAHPAPAQTPNGSSDRYCPCPAVPQFCYARRQVIHPTPQYLPRPVIHPTPRVEARPVLPPYPKATEPHIAAGPQPPWKVLPWQEPSSAPNVIKMIIRPPDTIGKGNLIDLFL